MRRINYYRIQYRKTGLIRFTSHLDVARAINRTLRRADLPVSYSCGFNPMPRLSFGPPLPLGVESETELLDIELTENLSEQEVTLALYHSLPPGLEVIKVIKLTKKVSSLMSSVNSIVYQIVIEVLVDKEKDEIETWFKYLWESKELVVVKKTKSGKKPVNIRPFWQDYKLSFKENSIFLFEMKVEFGPRGTLRPDNFISLFPQDFQVQRIIRKAIYTRAEKCCEKVL